MSENGLEQRFNVSRVDGRDAPGGDKADALYFVLDYVHDPFAQAALLAYADACEATLPALASDLRAGLLRTGVHLGGPRKRGRARCDCIVVLPEGKPECD